VSPLLVLLRRELALAWGRGGGPLPALAFYAGVTTLLPLAIGPEPERPAVNAPGIARPLQYADLAGGHDPAIAAIAGYRPLPKARDLMSPLIEQGQTSKAVANFRAAIAAYHNPWSNLFEKDLNSFGYALLESKDNEAAIAVFSLATDLYPESANAWDSLGEAWLAAGVRHRAAYCYARSLRLNPDNPQGRDTLASILGE